MTNFDVLAIIWHALVQKPLGFCLIDSDRLLENSRLCKVVMDRERGRHKRETGNTKFVLSI